MNRYDIGKQIRKEFVPTSPHGVIAEAAGRRGINRDAAQILRDLVYPDTGYSKSEFNQWFRKA